MREFTNPILIRAITSPLPREGKQRLRRSILLVFGQASELLNGLFEQLRHAQEYIKRRGQRSGRDQLAFFARFLGVLATRAYLSPWSIGPCRQNLQRCDVGLP